MRFCDLRSDMQSKPQALPAGPHFAPEEWLKQFFHRGLGDGIAGVRHGQFEQSVLRLRTHAHRLVGRAVTERIPDEIGDKLSNSDPVAIDRTVDRIFGLDLAARRRQSQFVDDLVQHGLERFAGIAIQRDAATEPSRAKSSTLSISPAMRMTVVCSIAAI